MVDKLPNSTGEFTGFLVAINSINFESSSNIIFHTMKAFWSGLHKPFRMLKII